MLGKWLFANASWNLAESVQDKKKSYQLQKRKYFNDNCINHKNCKIGIKRKMTFYVPSSYNLTVQSKLNSCQNNRPGECVYTQDVWAWLI